MIVSHALRPRIALLFVGSVVSAILAVPASPATANGGCGTVKEPLSGPAIAGVVPEGQSEADESAFCSGGDTFLTTRVKNVNLPDGTVLMVVEDFTPIGTITLSRGEGSVTVDIGHTTVSFTHMHVKKDATWSCASCGTDVLTGAYFS